MHPLRSNSLESLLAPYIVVLERFAPNENGRWLLVTTYEDHDYEILAHLQQVGIIHRLKPDEGQDDIVAFGMPHATAGFMEGVNFARRTHMLPASPEPYILGNQYRTQGGDLVRFVIVHNEGKSHETMEDEHGVNRYTRRDFGRCTGTAHDYSDPRNTPPLYAATQEIK